MKIHDTCIDKILENKNYKLSMCEKHDLFESKINDDIKCSICNILINKLEFVMECKNNCSLILHKKCENNFKKYKELTNDNELNNINIKLTNQVLFTIQKILKD